ncbi:MAG: PKD domain-containing protein, partial [bacterium]|nr:PKD domain-containing protein [bacterium]
MDGAATGDDTTPTARAGDDVTAETGAYVVLNGSASTAGEDDVLTYQWRQTAGSATVELEKADTPVARFWAPLLDSETTLEFTLTVSNGRADASDVVLVTVSTDTAPTAAAAELLIIASPAIGPSPLTVELTAARFDGGPLPEALYVWDFGDTATAEGPAVTHTFVGVGDYTVTLRAIDPDGAAGVIWTATTAVQAYDP